VDDPDAAAILLQFRDEVSLKWNLPNLHSRVIASQRRRQFHYEAQAKGTRDPWDFQPFQNASQRFMRNDIELDTLEAMARFPRVNSK
jgi:choline-sulfatase